MKTNDQYWNPCILSRQLDGPRKWPILIVPPLPIKRYQTRSIQVNKVHKFEAAPTCCPEGVVFPPRNVLIIKDICIFHAQVFGKKMAIYCPQGSGTLRQQLTIHYILHILHYLALSCTILHHVAPGCTMLHQVAPCCTMLHHVAPCCTMMHHVAPYCTM